MRSIILILFLLSSSLENIFRATESLTPQNKKFFEIFGFKNGQDSRQRQGSVTPCTLAMTSTTPAPIPLVCRVMAGSGQPNNNFHQSAQINPILVGLGSFSRPIEVTTKEPSIPVPGTVKPVPSRPERIPGETPAMLSSPNNTIVFLAPFIPSGFGYVNPSQTQLDTKCPLYPFSGKPLCSMIDTLDTLQLRKIHDYILKAGLEQLFLVTNNYTFLAPADPAFAALPAWFLASLDSDEKLLRAVILNHFIKADVPLESFGNDFLILNARPGGNRIRSNTYFPHLPYKTYTLDGSKVILGDLLIHNGRLNILNRVIVPNPRRNAAQYLQQIPEFSDFLSVVVKANMMEVLEGSDPITIFIPINAALETFDLDSLKGNESALKNFVSYHILHGTFYSEGLVNGQHLTTLLEKEVKVSVTSDDFTKTLSFVNNVNRVLKADIPLLNGVAHVMNGVMSTDPEFYLHQQMAEFPNLNFGTLKRRHFSISDNLI